MNVYELRSWIQEKTENLSQYHCYIKLLIKELKPKVIQAAPV